MEVDENVHEVLYSEAALLLGEIHWMILKAAHAMAEERWNKVQVGFGGPIEETEFGKEVGPDEIHWWIFRQEKDVGELVRWSEEALTAVHRLQVAATQLRRAAPETYEEVLEALRKFADDHQKEVKAVHKYVSWLESRHPMAPEFCSRIAFGARRGWPTGKWIWVM